MSIELSTKPDLFEAAGGDRRPALEKQLIGVVQECADRGDSECQSAVRRLAAAIDSLNVDQIRLATADTIALGGHLCGEMFFKEWDRQGS